MSNLREKLVEFRDAQAQKEAVEVYKVLQYPTIDAIAKVLPETLEELGKIKGIGPTKLKKYGAAILALVESEKSKVESTADAIVATQGVQDFTSGSDPAVSGTDFIPTSQEDEKQVISVVEYLEYLNLVFQKTADVKIQGEISAPKEYPSGMYFTLKDKTGEGVLNCFIPLYTYRGLGLPLEEGMEVRVEGVPRMVRRNGRFQFTVENLELAGEGALKKAYELLKAKLESEGLFSRKRELPEFISSVGIITSKAGAVIHDFRNNLAPLGIKLFLKDVRVEGARAPQMVIDAVKYFNKQSEPVDVLVILRGGGSLEDLKAFNDEQVVRTVFASNIPTIIAIGHDKDVPLAQMAADCMVSTPTAASHAVSNSWERLVTELAGLSQDLIYTYERVLEDARLSMNRSAQSLMYTLQSILERYKRISLKLSGMISRYMDWADRQNVLLVQKLGQIVSKFSTHVAAFTTKVSAIEMFLEQVSPERSLKLGYSIVRSADGSVIRSVAGVSANEILHTQLSDGSVESVVVRTEKE